MSLGFSKSLHCGVVVSRLYLLPGRAVAENTEKELGAELKHGDLQVLRRPESCATTNERSIMHLALLQPEQGCLPSSEDRHNYRHAA